MMTFTSCRALFTSLAVLAAPACGSVSSPDDVGADDTGTGSGSGSGDGAQDPGTDPEPPAAQVPGSLDATFGTAGIQLVDALGHGYAASLVPQGDKLLACATNLDGANWVVRVARLTAAGELDTTFGDSGLRVIAIPGYHTTCNSLAVRADGSVLVAGRFNSNDFVHQYSADGKSLLDAKQFATQLSKINTPLDPGQQFIVGTRAGADTQQVITYSGGAANIATLGGMSGSITRAFDIGGNRRAVIGALAGAWQMLVETQQGGSLVPLGVNAIVGDPNGNAFLKDAIELPDGSYFAVGGAASDLRVKVARFIPGIDGATSEEHMHGGPSSGIGVVLDGEDRPIVVGTARVNGVTSFGWQRYEAASTTLDKTYQSEGLAAIVPPSGQGELNAVAYLGGSIYALGTYDVETAEPKLALVRIVE